MPLPAVARQGTRERIWGRGAAAAQGARHCKAAGSFPRAMRLHGTCLPAAAAGGRHHLPGALKGALGTRFTEVHAACSRLQALMPEYAKAATALKDYSSDVILAKVWVCAYEQHFTKAVTGLAIQPPTYGTEQPV